MYHKLEATIILFLSTQLGVTPPLIYTQIVVRKARKSPPVYYITWNGKKIMGIEFCFNELFL